MVQGEYCLDVLLKYPEVTLLKVADGQLKSETYIFNKICEFVDGLREEDKLYLLDKMYLSNKFVVFFQAAREKLQGKSEVEIKKRLGVGKTYLKNYELISKSPLLQKSLDILYFSWDIDREVGSLHRTKYLTSKKTKYCRSKAFVWTWIQL